MADALRNLMGEDDCIKPSLTEMKLEPADADDLQQSPNIRKADKIRAILSENVSPESHRTVENILEQVNKLSTLDKLLLYLKLPTGRPAEACDPLRQPLNPLGSRSEIQLTINWIRSHYEEDPQVSLPKHEVYDDYTGYCGINSVKPLSTADFGKVMKQVFPAVRPRRLGTRGNSRYCYAGLRKRIKLDPPVTPDISAEPGRSRESLVGGEEEATSAASFLIREWVEKLLGVKFDNLPDLACHLLEKMYVDNRSVAAFTLLSRSGKYDEKMFVKSGLPPQQPPAAVTTNGTDSKLTLQRKLQEVNISNNQIKQSEQQKRKMAEQEMLIGKRSKVGDGPENSLDTYDTVSVNYDTVGVVTTVNNEQTAKLGDNQNRYSVVVQNNQNNQVDPVFINGNGGISFEGGQTVSSGEFQVSYNGDRIDTVMASAVGPRQVTTTSISLDKLPRKKQVVLVGGGELTSNTNGLPVTSVIKAGDKPRSKYKEEAAGANVWSGEVAEVSTVNTFDLSSDQPADLSGIRVNNWSGGSSSDNHEEELVQYFQHQDITEADETNDEKLSQLRQLLAKNMPGNSSSGAFKRTTNLPLREAGGGKMETVISSGAGAGPVGVAETVATVQTGNINQLSSRRRVSFHPLIVSDSDSVVTGVGGTSVSAVGVNCPIPPSPGTRRRHFSFQPISPRACGQSGSGQSPPASPFISPRSTPVPMLRSRHSSGSVLPLHLLPGNGGGRQQHPSGSGSDISRAATFGSASESSTPFISPMGTPIPFGLNRSRHNSASGRLCRSRHSSGVPLERQFSRQYSGNSVQTYSGNEATLERQYSAATAPYSPMALNNLNNPFSPQPSTIDIGDAMVGYPGGAGATGQYVGGGQLTVAGVAVACNNGGVVQDTDRSRHSSAGSDGQQCHARSAPMSPFNDAGVHVRQRHVSAGHVPASSRDSSHTIHYRPMDQFDLSVPAAVSHYNAPAGYTAAAVNNGELSHHSSYRNTPIPQEFQNEAEAEFTGLINTDEIVAAEPDNKIKDDDIDLALDALRNCDTDFIKFDEANSVSN